MVERALRMCKVAGSMPGFSIVIIFKCTYLFRITSFLLSYFSLFFTNFFHLHFLNSGMYFGIFTSKVKENFSGIFCIRSQIYIFINYEKVSFFRLHGRYQWDFAKIMSAVFSMLFVPRRIVFKHDLTKSNYDDQA